MTTPSTPSIIATKGGNDFGATAEVIPDDILKAAQSAYLSAFGEFGEAKDRDVYEAIAKAILADRRKHEKPVSKRPHLRDCPFCRADGSDDEKVSFMVNLMFYEGGEYIASYSILCSGCGVDLHDEYEDELVRLWNGEDKPADEE